MVATGSSTNKSQVIDVSTSSTACENLPSYPFAMSYAAGGVVNGSPIICGGYRYGVGPTNSCHRFDRNANSWKLHSSMTSRRYYHASTVVKNASLLLGVLMAEVGCPPQNISMPMGLFKVGPTCQWL